MHIFDVSISFRLLRREEYRVHTKSSSLRNFKPSKLYISHIGLIVALDYLNFRKIYDWEMKTKNLDAWHKQVSASMPGYKETYPKDPS